MIYTWCYNFVNKFKQKSKFYLTKFCWFLDYKSDEVELKKQTKA